MATISLNKIGSLVLGPDGTVDIGRLPAPFGFQGPFTSPLDDFLSWASYAKSPSIDLLRNNSGDDQNIRGLKQATLSFRSRLKSIIKDKPPSSCKDTYPIAHPDFPETQYTF